MGGGEREKRKEQECREINAMRRKKGAEKEKEKRKKEKKEERKTETEREGEAGVEIRK